jgi:hypothetical protein
LLRNQAFFTAPAAGYLLLYESQRSATFGRGGVVVRITTAPSRQAVINAAGALKPIPAAR